MSNMQRSKGARIEREMVHMHLVVMHWDTYAQLMLSLHEKPVATSDNA